ncbi:hypothetical protein BpHYR1_042658 [Brachionus plicatilis]|uniref:Uncharacterized protein n=1 Tax=Brachionus plicatilis TaxID=10195 RepID=A0A3M7Q9I7_BRAPC|nr:hypothetical protein BpHYR1_042658 [Brachionus plicatilis]
MKLEARKKLKALTKSEQHSIPEEIIYIKIDSIKNQLLQDDSYLFKNFYNQNFLYSRNINFNI